MPDVTGWLRHLGKGTIDRIWRLGFASRFFMALLAQSATTFLRPRLLLREIFFSGVLSLIIISISGLFVGLVLGLQGYETLQRYGSSEALGILVALSLTRELGPVVAALLFAARGGTSVTAEIGLMKATEQLTAMDMMAVNPLARVVAPRFWGGGHHDAAVGCHLFNDGRFWWLADWCGVHRGGRWRILVPDAGSR